MHLVLGRMQNRFTIDCVAQLFATMLRHLNWPLYLALTLRKISN